MSRSNFQTPVDLCHGRKARPADRVESWFMVTRRDALSIVPLWLGALIATLFVASANGNPADGIEFFEAKIRPLLIDRCMECHDDKKQKGGLRLDSRSAWLPRGDSGAVIVPGDPDASILIEAVRYADKDLQMPPKVQLTAREVAALELWVKMGAPDPRDVAGPAVRKTVDFAACRKAWAFQPVGHPQPPSVAEDRWSRGELDRFILAGLQQAGLQPSPVADRRALIRRVTFDLTGLPPTMEESRSICA